MSEPVVAWQGDLVNLMMEDMGRGFVAVGFVPKNESWNPYNPLCMFGADQLDALAATWLGISVEKAQEMRKGVGA